MFNRSELDQLLAAMRENGVITLDIKDKQQRVHLVLSTADAPSPPQSATQNNATSCAATSAFIGTFLQRGSDDGLPPLQAGDRVSGGEILGYVCHGPVRTIVNAPANGVLRDQGPANGAALGRGDTVFTLELTP